MLEGFNIKIEENISRLPPRATEIPDPKDIPDVPEVAEAKRRMVDTYLANIEFVEPVLKFGHNEFRYLRHAEWQMNCHEEDLPYLSIFVQSEVETGKVEEPGKEQEQGKEQDQGNEQEQGKELVIFCQASSPLPRLWRGCSRKDLLLHILLMSLLLLFRKILLRLLLPLLPLLLRRGLPLPL